MSSTDVPIEPRPIAPWGIWATLGFGLVIAVAFVLVQVGISSAFVAVAVDRHPGLDVQNYARSLEADGFVLAIVTCAAMVVTVGLVALFVRLRRQATLRTYLRLQAIDARTFGCWLGVVLLFAVSWDGLTYLLGRSVIPDFMLSAYQTAGFLPLFWIALVVAAPVAEEVFFRGFLFEGIRCSPLGPAGATLITALIWAAIHLQYDLYEITTVFVVGLLLAVARLWTDSLYTTIAMHSLMNFLAALEVAVYINYLGTSN